MWSSDVICGNDYLSNLSAFVKKDSFSKFLKFFILTGTWMIITEVSLANLWKHRTSFSVKQNCLYVVLEKKVCFLDYSYVRMFFSKTISLKNVYFFTENSTEYFFKMLFFLYLTLRLLSVS